MKKILLYLLPLFLLCHAGCERLLIEKDPANNPVENFDLLWNSVNEKYSFFTYKNIDWDSVYRVYRPQVHEKMPDNELFTLMAEMLHVLRDGHVNLVSPFDVSRNWSWYLDYPQNYNPAILERNYLGNDFEITGPFLNKKIDNVAYIRYSSFMNEFTDEQMFYLIDKFKDCSGIIFDIRNNGGGRIDLIARIVSFFAQQSQTTGYVRYKNGPGHNDFTPYYPQVVDPADRVFEQPVVVLTNRSVYSAANAFASQMASLPDVTLLGDRTGGGGGAPYSGELMNGWTFRFSTTQMVDLTKDQIEDGVQPGIRQDLLPADEAAGKDSILERALGYFK